MFKYPNASKPAPAPAPSSPFADSDVPSDWAMPAGQGGVDSGAAQGGFFGGAEPAPFETPAAAPAVATRNVLNSDVSVVGILRFTDDLLVDGSVEGEITSDGELTVGANATITAGENNKIAVRTKSAIIHGRVTGDIVVSDRVELASSAVLLGDVTAAKISIQEGAVFVGHCMVDPAGAGASIPATPTKKASKATSKNDSGNLLG
ncbi:MAG: polymer-forming cytoskeletal protein [Akkermansia sp.]|nr:polymer-forming cytoskeletal protein [Akkermansia sp.]